jgi:hypothetical protein
MKKSLVKSILSGALVTSFFLISCEKAPNRLSKGSKDKGKADGAEKPSDANKIWVDCSAEFLKKYKLSKELTTKLSSEKTEGLAADQTEELKKKAQAAGEKTDEAIAEITKVKTDADGCKNKDPKTKQSTGIYRIADIRREIDQVLLNLKTKAGIVVAQTSKAENSGNPGPKDNSGVESKDSLEAGSDFRVSKVLIEAFQAEDKAAEIILIGGSIMKIPADIAKNRGDNTKTICELKPEAKTSEAFKTSEKVKIITTAWLENSDHPESTRRTYSVTMLGQGDVFLTINCMIAEGKEKLPNAEVRSALGTHLQAYKSAAPSTNPSTNPSATPPGGQTTTGGDELPPETAAIESNP